MTRSFLGSFLFAAICMACANGAPIVQGMSDAAADTATGCSGCGANQTCCNNQCVDVTSNEAHCGTCGNACGTGQTCSTGSCKCMGSTLQTCATGTTCCPGTGCVNTNESLAHCGTCGNPCAAGQTCVSGTCALTACNNGQNCVSGLQVCLNATTCACGSQNASGRDACPSGQICVNGPGSTEPSLRRCVNLQTDAGNCREVGRVCSGATPNCCAGECVNTQTNPMHCGSCGHAAEAMRQNICVGGVLGCGMAGRNCNNVLGCACRGPAGIIPGSPEPTPDQFDCSIVNVGIRIGCAL